MKDYITTKGIVIKTGNIGEYDKRLVVLTEDRGKITIFARGVRRQNSKNLAAANPMIFGTIKAFPGKDAYSLLDFSVENYFEKLRTDFELSCLGMYFLEIADYYSRENNDDLDMLKLLYVSLKILEKIAEGKSQLSNRLIKAIYEIKAISVNGEFPGVDPRLELSESAAYAVSFIDKTRIEKLYSFDLKDEVLSELEKAADYYTNKFLNHSFKSLEILEGITL